MTTGHRMQTFLGYNGMFYKKSNTKMRVLFIGNFNVPFFHGCEGVLFWDLVLKRRNSLFRARSEEDEQ